MLEIFPDLEALSRRAAALAAARARQAVRDRGRFLLALSGGGTPARTYELLGGPPLRDQVAWPQVHFFWGDERCVPSDDPRSNYRLARAALLDRVPVEWLQVHPMLCGADPGQAARRYEDLLRRELPEPGAGFDLAFLGLGADGHTASLFPGQKPPAGCWVTPVRRAGEKIFRLTLTPQVLNRSRLVVFLVSGPDKAAALQAALAGDSDPLNLPARGIRPVAGEVRWLVDREAAALLGPGRL
jgi:6-phosphogluconolactonase